MKKLYTWLMITVIILPLTIYLILTFGNPQSSKYIFMWQCYVYPAKYELGKPANPKPKSRPLGNKRSSKWLPIHDVRSLYEMNEEPTDGSYTGTWRTWHKNGYLASEVEKVGGRRQNFRRSYYESTGKLRSVACYIAKPKYDSPVGWMNNYHENGTLNYRVYYQNDHPDVGLMYHQFKYDKEGDLTNVRFFSGNGMMSTLIYDRDTKVDLRDQYKKEMDWLNATYEEFKRFAKLRLLRHPMK